MQYIIEIHNTENDDVGVLMHDEDGVQVITKLDSWSKAKAKAGILSQATTTQPINKNCFFRGDN